MDNKYSYERFGAKGQRVGQAVCDILSSTQPDYTAEEIFSEMAPKIVSEIEEAVSKGNQLFDHEYFLLMYFNKDLTQFGVQNVVKMGFLIGDKIDDFDPRALTMKKPNWDKTLYAVDPQSGHMEIIYHLPDFQRCQMVAKAPHLYHADLSKWIMDCLDSPHWKRDYQKRRKSRTGISPD